MSCVCVSFTCRWILHMYRVDEFIFCLPNCFVYPTVLRTPCLVYHTILLVANCFYFLTVSLTPLFYLPHCFTYPTVLLTPPFCLFSRVLHTACCHFQAHAGFFNAIPPILLPPSHCFAESMTITLSAVVAAKEH